MAETLREAVRRMLVDSKLTYTRISEESGVPYGALYHFATVGDDMKSQHMENLYNYFTGGSLIKSDED